MLFKNSQSAMDAGYNPIKYNIDGTVDAVLSPMYQVQNKQLSDNFYKDTGVQFHQDELVTHESIQGSNLVLKQAGISETQGQGMVPAGTNRLGKLIYTYPQSQVSQDASQGSKMTSTLQTILDPTGVLNNKEDRNALNYIGAAASDTALLLNLTEMQKRGDTKGFINTLLGQYKKPLINEIGNLSVDAKADPKLNNQVKQGLDTSMDIYNLYNNWSNMSDAQKSIGIAVTGIKGFNLASGDNLFKAPIIKPDMLDNKPVPGTGMDVGTGLGLLQSGINVYALSQNWKDYNTIQKVIGGTTNAVSIAQNMQALGLIGKGATNAAVATTAENLASIGARAVPDMGIGALAIPAGNAAPMGYNVIASTASGSIIQPAANVASSTIAASSNPATITSALDSFGSNIGTEFTLDAAQQGTSAAAETASTSAGDIVQGAGTAVGAAAAAYSMYQGIKNKDAGQMAAGGIGAASLASGAGAGPGLVATGALTTAKAWGVGGVQGRTMGAIGGTAMGVGAIASMATIYGGLAAIGPVGWAAAGALAVGSVIAGSIKVGKSTAQGDRDLVRDQFHQTGLIDANHMVTLADGSKFDVGIDGHGGYHTGVDGSELQAFDTDYKNKLDFMAGMGGGTLARLTAGGKANGIDQVGNQLGNAALSSVGYGKELTRENFDKVNQNLRAMYAASGINSKEAGYALANQAYGEGRLNEQDHLAALQSLNFIFDSNGYDGSNGVTKLLGMQNKIMETIANAHPDDTKTVDVSTMKPTARAPAAFNNISGQEISGGPAFSTEGMVQQPWNAPGGRLPSQEGMVNLPYKVPEGTDVSSISQGLIEGFLNDPAPISSNNQPAMTARQKLKLMNISKDQARTNNIRMFGGMNG